jgi:hypothetical protein
MSMNATFVQVEKDELTRFKADPRSVAALFQDETGVPDVFIKLAKVMQDRVRLDPSLQQILGERLGKTPVDLAGVAGTRALLSLDKAWHGVHYLLCGEAEPGTTLVSQAVLGGAELGDDDEGFSGYGPPRAFTAAQVAELAQALSHPDVESEANARFDAAQMSKLGIYPGWRPSDADWVLDGFRRLRDFYSDAAAKGRAIVTCLV